MSSRIATGTAGAWQPWRMDSLDQPPCAAGLAAHGLPTVGEIESLQDRAQSEGYAEGRAEGAAKVAAEVERLRAVAQAMENSLAELQQQLAEDVLTLALDIARQVLQEALPVRRELLLPVVREAMRSLPADAEGAQILMNPADIEVVRAHFGEELRLSKWQLIEDHRIQPGGCRITSLDCDIDATLATRWKRVIAGLGRDHAWLDV